MNSQKSALLPMYLRISITFLVSLLLLAASLKFWEKVGHPLTGNRLATCMPNQCFCEAIRPKGVAQPANAWSCVAFVWLGVITLFDFRRLKVERPRNALGHHPTNSIVFGCATVLIGIGSAFFHASLTFVGQFFDVLGMYLLATFLVLYGIERLKPLTTTLIAAVYISVNFLLAIVLWELPAARRYIFAGLIVAVIIIEIIARRRAEQVKSSYFTAAILALFIGFVIWILDITHLFCSPYSWLQGHAVWHVSGAVAGGLIYRYFRTEVAVQR